MLNFPPLDLTIDTGLFDFARDESSEKIARSRLVPESNEENLLKWTIKNRPLLGPSRKFDIDSHQYLIDIYSNSPKEQVLMKASQMGASEWLVSYALFSCDQRKANVLYIFPTEGHVSDFSTARLGPAIESSEYLNSIVVDGSGQGGMRGSDRITLKRIRDRFLYFRGSKVQVTGQAPQLKSIDADVLIFDEVDELDPRAPAIARKRLGHAPAHLGNVLWVSTPLYPGTGIHAEWLRSDQKHWFIQCQHCNEKQSLNIDMVVEEWDSIGRPYYWKGKKDGTAWIGCVKCGKELDRTQRGEWVAAHPDRDVVGYHLSKLFSAQIQPLEVVMNLDTADDTKRREAFNQDLGLPYLPRGGHLTSEDLDLCRMDYGHGPDRHTTCFMGVDIGKVLHVVVRTVSNLGTGENRQLYAGESDWESLERLIKIYNPRTIVMDALPETTKARELQAKLGRNRLWISYYPNLPQGNKKESIAVWDIKEQKVLVDRTRALDAMFAGFYSRTSTLPYHARSTKDYYEHMQSSIRILKEDSSGQQVSTYVETGPDHYAHAETYCHIASICKIGQGWSEGSSR